MEVNWSLLTEDMTLVENQIAQSTFTKMNNEQQVSFDILARICKEFCSES